MSAFRMAVGMVLAATTSLAAASSLRAHFHEPAFDPASLGCVLEYLQKRVEVADRLQLNLDQSPRIIVPGKCRDKGEGELRALAASATAEEAYAFVPRLCTWIEIGHSETAISVRLDDALVDQLVQCHQKVALYHIHPSREGGILEHLPAYVDMLVAVLIQGKFFDQPFVSVSHHAVSARGAYDYSLVLSDRTRNLVETMKTSGLGDAVSENLVYEFARSSQRRKYYDAIRACGERRRPEAGDPASCFPMQAGDFVLEFRSFADPANPQVEPVAAALPDG
jgi:hypothetical protein